MKDIMGFLEMSKNTIKKGTFSAAQKTSFQKKFRSKSLDKLKDKKKSELEQDERAIISGKKALSPTRSKIGTNFNKQYSMNNLLSRQQPNDLDNFNLGRSVRTSEKIPIFGFLDKPSKTGVLSQKSVDKAMGSFVSGIKKAEGVSGVDVIKKGNKVTGFNVSSGYQKSQYSYNPKTMSFESKGMELDIPKNFKKVSGNRYVSPEKEFLDYYKYEKDGDDRDKRKDPKKYNPVEISLNPEGNKISKIIERGTYSKYKKREEDGDRIKYKKDSDVYTKKIKEFYDSGIIKREQNFEDYLKYKEEENRGKDKEYYKVMKDIFKKSDISYTPKGYKKSKDTYGIYTPYEKESEKGRYDSDYEKEQEVFLKGKEEYGDMGRLSSKKEYDEYLKERDVKVGSGIRKKEREGVYLKYSEGFEPYQSEDNTSKQRYAYRQYSPFLEDSKIIEGTEKISLPVAPTKSLKQQKFEQSKNQQGVSLAQLFELPTEKYSEDYDIGLVEESYYDPITGKQITNNLVL